MNAPALEGHIDICLQRQQARGQRVSISSSRPLQVANLLVGKSPAEALKLIPLLFAVCGVAQSRSALRAIQSSLGIEVDGATEVARDMLLQVETTREHLMRIIIDWPALFGVSAGAAELPDMTKRLSLLKQILFSDGEAFALDSRLRVDLDAAVEFVDRLQTELELWVFGISLDRWLAIDEWSGLDAWSQRGDTLTAFSVKCIAQQDWAAQGTSNCQHLPRLASDELCRRFDSESVDDFIAHPEWQGKLCESTPLSRQLQQPLIRELNARFGNGLITRWMARLVELANIPRRLRMRLEQLQHGGGEADGLVVAERGIAQVEAVRGRLIHRIEVNNDRIARFQILAPTEWNFHPRGLIAQCLDGLTDAGDGSLEQLARTVINAIDPCVGYRLTIQRS